MTRDELHEHLLYEILPGGPPVGAFAIEDDTYRLLYRNRSLYASGGTMQDALLLLDLMLDVPDLSCFIDIDEKIVERYNSHLAGWVYAWLLLSPEIMENAVRLRIAEPQNWIAFLNLFALLMHENCLKWIQEIADLALYRNLLDEELRQRIAAVSQKVIDEVNHPGNAAYEKDVLELLQFYGAS